MLTITTVLLLLNLWIVQQPTSAAGIPGIRSVQAGTISLGAGTNSATATITSVDTTKAVVLWGGATTTAGAANSDTWMKLVLTNGTTVTANRITSVTGDMVVSYTVLEFY